MTRRPAGDPFPGAVIGPDAESGIAAHPPADPPPPADATPPRDVPPDHTSIVDTPVAAPAGGTRRATKMTKQLEDLYSMLGTGIFAFDRQVGVTVLEQGPACAKALDELAATSPAVRRALTSLLSTSAWSAVIMAHLPIVTVVATKYVPYLREIYLRDVAGADAGAPPGEAAA